MPWMRSTCPREMTGPSATWPSGSPTGRGFALATSFSVSDTAIFCCARMRPVGHANLTLVEPGAESDRRSGSIEIGVVKDDDGVLAAKLKLDLFKVLAGEFADPASDVARAGERHHRDVGIGAQGFA